MLPNEEIIDGLKSKSASVKLLKSEDGNYVVEYKKYFMGFTSKKERTSFTSLSQAEDLYYMLKDKIKFEKFFW